LHQYIDYLHEFLNSSLVFEIKDDRYIQVKILSDSQDIYADDSYPNAFTFKYRHSYNNKAYSPGI